MKKVLLNLLLLLLVAPLLQQCATYTEVDEIRRQLRIVNKKIDDMRSTTVSELQKNQAASTGQMDQLEQEILILKTSLEETYHLNQRLREQNKELEVAISSVAQEEAAKREQALRQMEEVQRDREAKLADLNQKLQQQQENVRAIQEARLREIEREAKEAALAAEMARKKTQAASSILQGGNGTPRLLADQQKVKKEVTVAPTPPPSEPAPPTVTSTQETAPKAVAPPTPAVVVEDSGQTLFAQAQRLFTANNFSAALPLFEKIAEESANPQSVEARFMTGESLFNLKEYDKAIMQFQKIISQQPSHSLAPSAMLKQGISFENLNDKDTAKVIYRKLLSRHPEAAEAAQAQERLGKL